MRAALRQQLVNQVSDVDGRVYEPHAASAKTEKPYLVIRQGVDVENNPWTGFRRIVEIWPYVARTTFQSVDSLAKKVTAALDKQLLTMDTGEVFTCLYLGTVGTDFIDEDWGAITRGLRFAVMALQPVAVPETVVNDTWVEAIANWSENLLGTGWTVYRNRWPLGYVRPAVLWRLTNFNVEGINRSGFEVKKSLVGHVLGGTPNEETQGVLQIIDGLTQAIKVPLDMESKKYMTVITPRGNFQVNALERGQVTVTLTRKTKRPQEEVPLMQKIEGRGTWR